MLDSYKSRCFTSPVLHSTVLNEDIMSQTEQVNFRLPVELRDWLRQQKDRNRSSVTSEIVRAIQERKDRMEFKPSGDIGAAA